MKILTSKNNREEWISLWRNCDGKEVFAHPDYLDLYTGEKSEACCAVFQDGMATIIYPFIKRDLRSESFCDEPLFDLTTAYGYGDIYAYGEWDGTFVKRFCKKFTEWAKDNNIVCEFIRFSLNSVTREYYLGESIQNNRNIAVDLTLDAPTTWKNFKHKVRKNVNRAKSHNIRIEFDKKGERLDDFLKIYYDTMNRRDAGQGYYFPREFFEMITNKLENQFIFCHALYDDKIISTELVFTSDDNIYSFLGGTYDEYFEMRPNDILKFEIINWGRDNDKKRFILGGGYVPMDGIFQYKQAFAPDGVVPFFIGTQIFDPEKYYELVDNKRKSEDAWNPDEKYFPLYRS